MKMNSWNGYLPNEYAGLIESYQNVSLQVEYLQEIIKNFLGKIQES